MTTHTRDIWREYSDKGGPLDFWAWCAARERVEVLLSRDPRRPAEEAELARLRAELLETIKGRKGP